MALTRSFKETVVQRVQNDATFAQALLDEAATLFFNGEPETARLILRDLGSVRIQTGDALACLPDGCAKGGAVK